MEKVGKNSSQTLKTPSGRAFQLARRLFKNSLKTISEGYGMQFGDAVGDVELRLVFGGHPSTVVAHGEVGQVFHLADLLVPLTDGIAVGHDDDVTSLQRKQRLPLEIALVARQELSYLFYFV